MVGYSPSTYFYPRSPCGERHPRQVANRWRAQNFYPRSPCGERLIFLCNPFDYWQFLSTLSLRRATQIVSIFRSPLVYFYPRSPCGERPAGCSRKPWISTSFLSTLSLRRATKSSIAAVPRALFLSTLSLRRATVMHSKIFAEYQFLSTLSLRRATILGNPCAGCPAISIHALLAESDEPETAYTDSAKTISIHALLAESDQLGAVISTLVAGFLSTLSLRRATWGSKPQQPWHCNFYPRSPCGERRNNSNNELVCTVFLSTLSLRRATL